MIESGKALINLYNGNIYENFADELTHSLNMLNKTSFADKAENILEKWNELSDLIYDLTSKFDEDEYDEEQIEKANERIYELNPLIKNMVMLHKKSSMLKNFSRIKSAKLIILMRV